MSISAEHDEALVARAGAGDRTAASALIVRHTDKMMAICYRMLGERAAAEDAVQETFLRLWKSASSWRPKGAKFETWLCRVAMNVCLDRLRKGGREVLSDTVPELADEAPDAEMALVSRDTKTTVDDAIAQLPERQRMAITLCHYEELSNIEAAEVLETSVEAVESLLGRARRSLKAALAPMKDELLERGGVR